MGKHRWTIPEDTLSLVRELVRQIVRLLNRAGKPTGRGNGWTQARVRSFCSHHGIAVHRPDEWAERGGNHASSGSADYGRERNDSVAHGPARHRQRATNMSGRALGETLLNWIHSRFPGFPATQRYKRRRNITFRIHLYAWCAEDPSPTLDERIYVTFSRHEEPQKALAPVPTMSGLPLTADVETSDQMAATRPISVGYRWRPGVQTQGLLIALAVLPAASIHVANRYQNMDARAASGL